MRQFNHRQHVPLSASFQAPHRGYRFILTYLIFRIYNALKWIALGTEMEPRLWWLHVWKCKKKSLC